MFGRSLGKEILSTKKRAITSATKAIFISIIVWEKAEAKKLRALPFISITFIKLKRTLGMSTSITMAVERMPKRRSVGANFLIA